VAGNGEAKERKHPMKKLWLKQTILTLGLTLGFAAVASAQTTSATCGDWVATKYGGYCASSPPASAATAPWQSVKPIPPAVTSSPTTTPSASAQPSNWLDATCPNKEPVEAWRQCVMAVVEAKQKTLNAQIEASAQQIAFNQQLARQQCTNWVTTSYGGYCAATPQTSVERQEVINAQFAAQQKLQQQQAEYQRQLLQQQAQYQQQLLQQQADIARRQMALQFLMNRPIYTPPPLTYNPAAIAAPMTNMNNNNIHCTTQYIGNPAYTNCY
jgi:hypothetical protein